MTRFSVTAIETAEQLDDLLTLPGEADIAFAKRLRGDVMILGAGGKMGPTLAKRFRRASDAAGSSRRVLAVSRFQSGDGIHGGGAPQRFDAASLD